MSIEREIDKALITIGRARRGKIKCQDALDELWELLINIDFEIRTRRNTQHVMCN